MNCIFLSQSACNALKAFGVDLVTTPDLLDKLDWQDRAHSMAVAQAVLKLGRVDRLGLYCRSEENEPTEYEGLSEHDLIELAMDNGLIKNQHSLIDEINVVARTDNTLIFYVDEELDHCSSLAKKVVLALGKIKTAEEVMKTSVWSNYCKLS
jgi:hypothetical protein